mmetsp:Transcript_1357/g.3317  ORF Transcript_1357/g.3317 Transcript_1357/m.3317 type:complete len:223 (-) Transcript_1357:109-777(-)
MCGVSLVIEPPRVACLVSLLNLQQPPQHVKRVIVLCHRNRRLEKAGGSEKEVLVERQHLLGTRQVVALCSNHQRVEAVCRPLRILVSPGLHQEVNRLGTVHRRYVEGGAVVVGSWDTRQKALNRCSARKKSGDRDNVSLHQELVQWNPKIDLAHVVHVVRDSWDKIQHSKSKFRQSLCPQLGVTLVIAGTARLPTHLHRDHGEEEGEAEEARVYRTRPRFHG